MKHIKIGDGRIPIVTADTYGDDVFPRSPLRKHGYVPMRGCVAMRYHRHVMGLWGASQKIANEITGEYLFNQWNQYDYPFEVCVRYIRMLYRRSMQRGAMREVINPIGKELDESEPVENLITAVKRAAARKYDLHWSSSRWIGEYIGIYLKGGHEEQTPITRRTLIVRHKGRVFLVDKDWTPDHLKASVSQLLQEIQETGMCYVETKQRVSY